MAIDREKARAAGYTDEEIDAYEAEQAAQAQSPVASDGAEPPAPPPPDPNQGSAGGTSIGEVASTAAAAAAPYALPAAVAGAGIYGAAKVGGWGRDLATSARDVASAMRERTGVEAARESRMANRPGFGGTPRPVTGPAPTMSYGMPTQSMPYAQAPMQTTRPVAPQPMQPPAQPASGATAQTIRQMAMDRLRSIGPMAARAATGIGALMYSPGLNTNEDEELERYRAIARQQGMMR